MLEFELNSLFFDYKRGNCSAWAGPVIVSRVLGVIFLGLLDGYCSASLLSCFQSPVHWILCCVGCRIACLSGFACGLLKVGCSGWVCG